MRHKLAEAEDKRVCGFNESELNICTCGCSALVLKVDFLPSEFNVDCNWLKCQCSQLFVALSIWSKKNPNIFANVLNSMETNILNGNPNTLNVLNIIMSKFKDKFLRLGTIS